MGHVHDHVESAASPHTAVLARGKLLEAVGVRHMLAAADGLASVTLGWLGRMPSRAGILMPNGEPWLRAAFAAWRLDAAVVPLPLPAAFAGPDAYFDHVARLCREARLEVVFAGGRLGERLRVVTDARVVDPSTVSGLHGSGPDLPPLGPGGPAPAVIQYTSGSTSRPKGVLLSHDNVLAGLAAISDASGWRTGDVLGSWLPLFHDMGLFSVLSALAAGSSVCLWAPGDFVRRPMRWLQELARSPATGVPAPNFFFDLLTTAAAESGIPADLDLSRWRIASNGAEPVHRHTIENFETTFAPYGLARGMVHPTYGMAEATLMATFPAPFTGLRSVEVDRATLEAGSRVMVSAAGPRTRSLVSCGRPVPGIELRIACGPAETADEGTIGEIQLTGSSVTAGYVGVDAKAQPFSQDGWLRTGDLGFLLDGELFVVGRLKDMVIVHGQNFYAEDVEDVVRKTPGLDRQVCAAFGRGISHDERERMVVLWETGLLPGDAAVAVDRIIRRLSDQLGLVAVEVVPVVANTIPFTSSGKVKRSAAIGVWRSARAAADAIDLLSESRPSERIHA